MEIYVAAIIILIALAISDLIVGVSNDAVNFLNSSIGSKVASRKIILIIASGGILAGVTFSSGMMEVARKGIFHPKQFVMPELMVIFLAVMLTDILLLDLYNTFGLPTSTTVSIVFELLGAAVAVSIIKIKTQPSGKMLGEYINTSKAMIIIAGIFLSVIAAFLLGAIIQYITRFIFTFDYKARIKRYGPVWGGIAISTIVYFILIKGAKGASFMTKPMQAWIKGHTILILLIVFIVIFLILLLLMSLMKINILKIIILTGTFAIAMAFAANDLVNFIGVPLAGLNSFQVASASDAPLTLPMEALQRSVSSSTVLLLIAGVVMVATLWISRKARTVTKTELALGRQDEGIERFGSSTLARIIIRIFASASKTYKTIIPNKLRERIEQRWNKKGYRPESVGIDDQPSFDQLRASVNLVVASALISFATSLKLPLSTTYVTFMVSMGTSLSDRAWDSESAVYRVTGVLTVVGGWFFTAFMAFTVSALFALVIYFTGSTGVIGILLLVIFIIIRNHKVHSRREGEDQATEVFNLKKISDAEYAINASFEHSAYFLQGVEKNMDASFSGLFSQNRLQLKRMKKETTKTQKWANIISANIFKTLRLLQQQDVEHTQRYRHTIRSLQEIAESNRDAIMRAFTHLDNNHQGLLPVQIEELKQIKTCLKDLLESTSQMLLKKEKINHQAMNAKLKQIKKLVLEFDKNQISRIQDDTSKTRLSILFYGLMEDSVKIAEHTLHLLTIFGESFKLNKK